MSEPVRLTGLSRAELSELVSGWGEKPYRVRQLWSWLYVRLASEWDAMTDLSKDFRSHLAASCGPLRPRPVEHQVARDGTEKWLLELADGQVIETVFIPEEGRGTLCISSQAGCTLNCPFCHTGAQGFARNLTTSEIVEQVLLCRQELATRDQRLTNIVLMGMGEPLYNYDAVAKALRILMDDSGVAIGTRKITLSTAGVAPRLHDVGHDLGVNLAISLHAVRDALRDELVPLNRKYDLAALRRALQDYPLKGSRRITWEYVLLADVNDSPEDAREMARYLRGIPSKINLIPFNPWQGSPYLPATPAAISRFQDILHAAGYVTVIRESRGADIAAACGQLKGRLPGVHARRTVAAFRT
ncbi:MAG: 23S rRNA (adenine(2503)-C(2))-methyltransferase RlmN [Magnetococcales bacterium]|nr:23S rRNA (adenine(2503)-C(2))-methyltransferase RlmN [Magnetococcales bacterium]